MASFLNFESVRVQSLKLWLIKKILSLPTAILRSVSGGTAVHIKGRTLDPQFQYLGRSFFNTAGHSPMRIARRTVEQARHEWAEMNLLLGLPSGLKVSFTTVEGDIPSSSFGGMAPISGLLIKPQYIDPYAPLLVFFHQGGGIIGGPEVSKSAAAIIAATAKCPVFLPDYRLAPLHRFPAALEDAHAAVEWAMSQATQLGVKSDKVAVGGILTGANLALRVCIERRRDFKPLPKHMTLITPLLDLSDPDIKSSPFADSWPISGADIDTMIAHYAGADANLSAPQISPLFETILNGLPHTLIVAAGFDPLVPQAQKMASRLIEAGVMVDYRQFETLPLGFDIFAGLVCEANRAMTETARLIQSSFVKDIH